MHILTLNIWFRLMRAVCSEKTFVLKWSFWFFLSLEFINLRVNFKIKDNEKYWFEMNEFYINKVVIDKNVV